MPEERPGPHRAPHLVRCICRTNSLHTPPFISGRLLLRFEGRKERETKEVSLMSEIKHYILQPRANVSIAIKVLNAIHRWGAAKERLEAFR